MLKNVRVIILVFSVFAYLVHSTTILSVFPSSVYGASQSMPAKNNNNNKTSVSESANNTKNIICFKQIAKQLSISQVSKSLLMHVLKPFVKPMPLLQIIQMEEILDSLQSSFSLLAQILHIRNDGRL
jgi:hypothetical protein